MWKSVEIRIFEPFRISWTIFELMNSSKILYSILGILFCFSGIGLTRAQSGKNESTEKQKMEIESLFFDATKAEMLENPEEASRIFEKLLSLDPENSAAHYKIAGIQIKQNKIAEALKHSKKATKFGKDNYYYWLQYAQLLEDNKEWKEAIKSYRYLVDHFPEQQQYRLSIAQIYIRNGKVKEAVKELDGVEQFLGASNELFQLRQKLFIQQGKLDAAIEDGNRWISVLGEEPEPYFSVAQLLIANNRIPEAKKILFQMSEKFPSNPTAHLMLADIYINEKDEVKAEIEMIAAFKSPDLPIGAKIDIVSGYLRGMDSDEEKRKAIELCDLILQVHPEDSRSYIIKGDILSRMNDKRGARDMFLKAKLKDKNNFGLWEQTILIDLTLNEIDSLTKHTSAAKELFPNTPSFSFYNGMGNMMQKKYVKAIESLEHASRISLENREMQFEIYSQLGDAYYNTGDKEKAWQSFDEALKLDSNSSHVLNNYSYFLSLDKVRLELAKRMSAKLVKLYPNDETFLDTYGWVLYQNGLYTDAFEQLEKATKSTASGVIWEHYGDVLFKLGKIPEACIAWKKASELGGEVSEGLLKKIKEKKLN